MTATATSPLLRLVVVLYRCKLARIRPLVDLLREQLPSVSVVLHVVINRDEAPATLAVRRRAHIDKLIRIEISVKGNATGVAGAYNAVLDEAADDDLVVLLDADGKPPPQFLTAVLAAWDTLRQGHCFMAPDLTSIGMRVSPYRLQGIVPLPIEGPLAEWQELRFSAGYGVINSCLAGCARGFRRVNGFDPRVPLDLSDVAWSIAAARCGASVIMQGAQEHDLSMRSAGLSSARLKRYLSAVVRLGVQTGDPRGLLRMALRGLRAHRALKSLL